MKTTEKLEEEEWWKCGAKEIKKISCLKTHNFLQIPKMFTNIGDNSAKNSTENECGLLPLEVWRQGNQENQLSSLSGSPFSSPWISISNQRKYFLVCVLRHLLSYFSISGKIFQTFCL